MRSSHQRSRLARVAAARSVAIITVASLALVVSETSAQTAAAAARPNVLLIMTDDHGYGDFGFTGNPWIRAPNLNQLARQSVWLTQFYVSPVCTPTRASLMTGRYNFRTRAIDTYLGRAMMDTEEVTLAELLSAAGYRTGIFGKWHLGDNYPLRPQDQGFQQSLVHRGGGIGQPSDPPGNGYFHPILMANGRQVRSDGYASDVFTSAAMRFIEQCGEEPFFAYLAFNCPHTPLTVSSLDRRAYRGMDFAVEQEVELAKPRWADAVTTSRLYAMISNIDDNLGRLFTMLERSGVAERTLVIFLTDNGPQQFRFNAGLRGVKGQVYDGGIRTNCLVRLPGQLSPSREVNLIAAHIDIVPTVLEACGVPVPSGLALDGRSLWPLLNGDDVPWPDRELFFQWHRGDAPQPFRNAAVRNQRYKLVQPQGVGDQQLPERWAWQLFDMENDREEQHDIAADHADIVAQMSAAYERWFADVSQTRGYAPPRIVLGTPHENPTILTRQDWRGPVAGWAPGSIGHWEVDVAEQGTYQITLRFDPATEASIARWQLGELSGQVSIPKGARSCVFEPVQWPAGPAPLSGGIESEGKARGVNYVDVLRVHE